MSVEELKGDGKSNTRLFRLINIKGNDFMHK